MLPLCVALTLCACLSEPENDRRGSGDADEADAASDAVDDTAGDSGATDAQVDAIELVACDNNTDCRGGEICRSGFCREACSPSDECAGQLSACDDELGYCVECVGNGDCAANHICVDAACAFFCSSDDACAPEEFCDADTGSCEPIECREDTDCSGGFWCVDFLCVPIE